MVNEELRQDLEEYANENSSFGGQTMTTLEQLTSGQDVYGESQSGIKQISDGLTGYKSVEDALRGSLSEPKVLAVQTMLLKDITRQRCPGKTLRKHYN